MVTLVGVGKVFFAWRDLHPNRVQAYSGLQLATPAARPGGRGRAGRQNVSFSELRSRPRSYSEWTWRSRREFDEDVHHGVQWRRGLHTTIARVRSSCVGACVCRAFAPPPSYSRADVVIASSKHCAQRGVTISRFHGSRYSKGTSTLLLTCYFSFI